ncbi:MAG: hypothetical protein ACT4OZ_06190 [Gemmatimonadota bacterium]
MSAICTQGPSLRQAIGDDLTLARYSLVLDRKQTPGREPGWLKLRASDRTRGVINVVWDAQANILTARVVTKGSHRPSPIVGDFVTYLLARHRKRIKAITTALVR